MLANYGYTNGSGDYFITIDTDRCDGCGDCVQACPYGVLETGEDVYDPFREIPVARVNEQHRKKIKYSCAPCKPTKVRKELPCILSCKPSAITHSW
ncbi:MAG: 4Fe-4S binding protein [Fidelibacterota bacterium]